MLIASSKCIISSDLYKVQHPLAVPREQPIWFERKKNSISFHCERLVIKVPLISMHRLLPHFKTTLTRDTQKLWFIIIIFSLRSVKQWIEVVWLSDEFFSFVFKRNQTKIGSKQVSMSERKSFAFRKTDFYRRNVLI